MAPELLVDAEEQLEPATIVRFRQRFLLHVVAVDLIAHEQREPDRVLLMHLLDAGPDSVSFEAVVIHLRRIVTAHQEEVETLEPLLRRESPKVKIARLEALE